MTKKDKNTIDLPEVSDIPGQEHIRAPRLGELADSTASSADEEGDDILEDGDDDLRLDERSNVESNVSKDEKAMLGSIDRRRDDSEDESLRTGLLDSTDEDGTPLNEKSFGNERNDDLSADDLDVPEENDEMTGEEDEENEDYSLSDNNDDDDREINPDL
jgi:hypothetical protein